MIKFSDAFDFIDKTAQFIEHYSPHDKEIELFLQQEMAIEEKVRFTVDYYKNTDNLLFLNALANHLGLEERFNNKIRSTISSILKSKTFRSNIQHCVYVNRDTLLKLNLLDSSDKKIIEHIYEQFHVKAMANSPETICLQRDSFPEHFLLHKDHTNNSINIMWGSNQSYQAVFNDNDLNNFVSMTWDRDFFCEILLRNNKKNFKRKKITLSKNDFIQINYKYIENRGISE